MYSYTWVRTCSDACSGEVQTAKGQCIRNRTMAEDSRLADISKLHEQKHTRISYAEEPEEHGDHLNAVVLGQTTDEETDKRIDYTVLGKRA